MARQLWHGGTIYTMEKESQTVESVLVSGDTIVATGPEHNLRKEADECIDLQGATMYPGFVDSHLHMIFQGEKLTRIDLSKARNAEEMLAMIREKAKTTPADEWLFGEGWNELQFPDQRIPTIEELDSIRKEPILLTRICHHALLGNSAALAAGHITSDFEAPAGGIIGRDTNGKLNGLLYEQAMNPVIDAVPREGNHYKHSLSEVLELAIDDMLAKGLTGGHTDDLFYFGHYHNPLTAFRHIVGVEKHFRVNLLIHHGVFEEVKQANALIDDSFIEPGAMKLFVDGALGNSTAALTEPYADQPDHKGLFMHTPEQIEESVKLARQYHEAVAVHVIGDAAVEQILHVIEKYPPPKGKRDRLIHCCVLRPELIERMAQLPVVADIQPSFVSSDFPWVEDRLGPKRLALAYPWKTLLQRGVMCAAGSDAPVEDVNPIATIFAAVERKKPCDHQHKGYVPEQKLSRFEAIQMYTTGSAQAIGKEQERGLIKPGYVADFSIFDRDLLKGSAEDMLHAKAVKTVVAGRVVFEG